LSDLYQITKSVFVCIPVEMLKHKISTIRSRISNMTIELNRQ